MKYWLYVLGALLYLQPGMAQQACSTKAHSEFDFWLGKWEVRLEDGTLVGHNNIVKEAGDCLLREAWVSAQNNFSGSSLNFYDPDKKRWEQLWVDSAGNVLRLLGGIQEGKMVMESVPEENSSGRKTLNRISWAPLADGRVRQLWEVLENGTVKQVVFDGYYKRME